MRVLALHRPFAIRILLAFALAVKITADQVGLSPTGAVRLVLAFAHAANVLTDRPVQRAVRGQGALDAVALLAVGALPGAILATGAFLTAPEGADEQALARLGRAVFVVAAQGKGRAAPGQQGQRHDPEEDPNSAVRKKPHADDLV